MREREHHQIGEVVRIDNPSLELKGMHMLLHNLSCFIVNFYSNSKRKLNLRRHC